MEGDLTYLNPLHLPAPPLPRVSFGGLLPPAEARAWVCGSARLWLNCSPGTAFLFWVAATVPDLVFLGLRFHSPGLSKKMSTRKVVGAPVSLRRFMCPHIWLRIWPLYRIHEWKLFPSKLWVYFPVVLQHRMLLFLANSIFSTFSRSFTFFSKMFSVISHFWNYSDTSQYYFGW